MNKLFYGDNLIIMRNMSAESIDLIYLDPLLTATEVTICSIKIPPACLYLSKSRRSATSGNRLNEHVDYDIEGIPQSVEQARYLFEQDPFQFQYWAVERTGGFCSNKKTADKGIDGRLYFETAKTLCSMVLSVKGGSIKPADIQDLHGVLEREQGTELAGFICLKEPTKAMIQEAGAAGFYEYQGVKYPSGYIQR